MTSVVFRCAAMLAAFSCLVQVALASDIMVMDAMARASLTPMAKTGAIYLSIMNHGSSDDVLQSISTPVAEGAEIHETKMDGDIMKMRALEKALVVTAGSTIKLEPGGMHVMLTGLKAPLKKGDSVALELLFEKAGVLNVDVPVGEIATGHEHGD